MEILLVSRARVPLSGTVSLWAAPPPVDLESDGVGHERRGALDSALFSWIPDEGSTPERVQGPQGAELFHVVKRWPSSSLKSGVGRWVTVVGELVDGDPPRTEFRSVVRWVPDVDEVDSPMILELCPTGWVTGRFVDHAGAPVPGVELTVSGPKGAEEPWVLGPGDDGRFSVGPVAPGVITLAWESDSVEGRADQGQQAVMVLPGGMTPIGDVVVEGVPALSGVVVDDGGDPVMSEIALYSGQKLGLICGTGDDGRFRITGPMDGVTKIEVVPADGARYVRRWLAPVSPAHDQRVVVERRRLPLVSASFIAQDEDGAPLSGAIHCVVSVGGAAHRRVSCQTYSEGGCGSFRRLGALRQLPPGTWEIWAWSPELGRFGVGTVAIGPGHDVADPPIRVRLRATGTVARLSVPASVTHFRPFIEPSGHRSEDHAPYVWCAGFQMSARDGVLELRGLPLGGRFTLLLEGHEQLPLRVQHQALLRAQVR